MNQSTQSTIAQRGFSRGNRANMGKPVEKAKDEKKTIRRMIEYFKPDIKYVIWLALAVLAAVVGSVIAPGLQANAIDDLVSGAYDDIPKVLGLMVLFYAINGAATLLAGILISKTFSACDFPPAQGSFRTRYQPADPLSGQQFSW